MEDLKDDPEEKNYVSKVMQFLNNNKINYHYCYRKPEDDDFYEVHFEAQRNEKNVKPSYIESWCPCEGIDFEVLCDCVKAFCKKFLNMEIDIVELKESLPFEDALERYTEEMIVWQKDPKHIFTDSLIEQLQNKWNVPKERVLTILNRSIK